MIVSGLFIGGEVTWWLGVVLLGKQMYVKYKKYLNPVTWFERKKVVPEIIEPEPEEKNKIP